MNKELNSDQSSTEEYAESGGEKAIPELAVKFSDSMRLGRKYRPFFNDMLTSPTEIDPDEEEIIMGAVIGGENAIFEVQRNRLVDLFIGLSQTESSDDSLRANLSKNLPTDIEAFFSRNVDNLWDSTYWLMFDSTCETLLPLQSVFERLMNVYPNQQLLIINSRLGFLSRLTECGYISLDTYKDEIMRYKSLINSDKRSQNTVAENPVFSAFERELEDEEFLRLAYNRYLNRNKK